MDAQEARVSAYCTAMGWEISEVVRDAGESAKSLRRPGITAIIGQARNGSVERIVVAKLDRLRAAFAIFPTSSTCASKHDVALVSVGETIDTSSAAGRMVVNMLGVAGQWEREHNALLPDASEQHALREAMRMDHAAEPPIIIISASAVVF